MRTAITLAYHKGGELVEMLAGPLTSIDEQRANFKQARQSKVHPQFERIEYWESGAGCVLHHNYREGITVAKTPVASVPVTEPPPSEPTPPPPPSADEKPAEHEQTTETDEAADAAEFETGKSEPKPKKRR